MINKEAKVVRDGLLDDLGFVLGDKDSKIRG